MKGILLSLVVLASCTRGVGPDQIVKMNIIDRNGMNETIDAKERLERYQGIDFLKPHPYAKVLRIFGADDEGNIHSVITSYYPNGQVHQYLEVVDQRAYGAYREWHEGGKKKLEAQVIAGKADIDVAALQTFVFDGVSHAWDEEGKLLAEIPYVVGRLNGTSTYYHPLITHITYKQGKRVGEARGEFEDGSDAFVEFYDDDLLLSGTYFDRKGKEIARIVDGKGTRVVFGEKITELRAYEEGAPMGKVQEVGERGALIRSYQIQDGEKVGQEVEYYTSGGPKLSITWHKGEIQGLVRTWYPSGQLQSQREMCASRKNGVSTAWYEDGSLMLLEEYHRDKLVKGEYFPRGSHLSASSVVDGKGIATLYDSQGNFLNRIAYIEGAPREDEA